MRPITGQQMGGLCRNGRKKDGTILLDEVHRTRDGACRNVCYVLQTGHQYCQPLPARVIEIPTSLLNGVRGADQDDGCWQRPELPKARPGPVRRRKSTFASRNTLCQLGPPPSDSAGGRTIIPSAPCAFDVAGSAQCEPDRAHRTHRWVVVHTDGILQQKRRFSFEAVRFRRHGDRRTNENALRPLLCDDKRAFIQSERRRRAPE